MQTTPNKLVTADTLLKLQTGIFTDWEYLYDNYSSILYGVILQMTDNTEIANKILLEAFKCFKTTKLIGNSLIICLIKCTKIIAGKYIETKQPHIIQAINF